MSFATVLEEAATRGTYFFGGNITDLDRLFDPKNFPETRHIAKAFCFLAFHGARDTAIADYVRDSKEEPSTLSDDSRGLMVLFTLAKPAPVPMSVDGVEFSFGTHQAYEMVDDLFRNTGKPVPALPGLVVFDDLAAGSEAIYVPLGHLNSENDVRKFLRELFPRVSHAADKAKPDKFLDDLGVLLQKAGFKYERTSRRSVREWLLQGFRLVRRNSGDIVSVIGLFQ